MSNVFQLPFDFTYGYATSPKSVRLPFPPFNSGTWTFSYNHTTHWITFECSKVSGWVVVESVVLLLRCKTTVNKERSADSRLRKARFPPSPTWSVTCYSIGDGYPQNRPACQAILVMTLDQSAPCSEPFAELKREVKQVASRNTSLFNSHSPNDVVFYFPRSKRELWASSAVLRKASAYFDTLFESEFKESKSSPVSEFIMNAVGALTNSHSDGDLAQDSDDDTDQVSLASAATRTKSTLPPGVKEVVIKSATYTTYHAVIGFIHSGFITFAPLSSPSLVAKNPSAAHSNVIAAAAAAGNGLPLPASPKSVYKLAHLLELEGLMKLALDNYKSKLTVDNVLFELASDMSVYDPVKEALVAFATANWASVRKTAVARELTKAEVVDGLPNASAAVAGLFELALKAEKLEG